MYTTIMELGPQSHNGDGLLGPNSIIVVYMDPLGNRHPKVWSKGAGSTVLRLPDLGFGALVLGLVRIWV